MKKDKHIETFVKNVKKHKKCDKIAFLVAYFYKNREDFEKFEECLLTLNKFKKIFANLCKNAKKSAYADAAHSYCKSFFKSYSDNEYVDVIVEENSNVARGLNVKIKIKNFLYFIINEYVAVDKNYFKIELVFGKFKNKTLYVFSDIKEIFAVYNLTNYAIKHNILDKNDETLKKLYIKSMLLKHLKKKEITKEESLFKNTAARAVKLLDIDESSIPF